MYVENGINNAGQDEALSLAPDELSCGRCVLTRHTGFCLLNVYVINSGIQGANEIKKIAFYDQVKKLTIKMNELGMPLVIAGDINTSHLFLDVYSSRKFEESGGCRARDRQWLTAYFKQCKMVDAWRETNPKKRQYTYWATKLRQRKGNYGLRLDVFYISKDISDYSATIRDDIEGSDHCPVCLVLPNSYFMSVEMIEPRFFGPVSIRRSGAGPKDALYAGNAIYNSVYKKRKHREYSSSDDN